MSADPQLRVSGVWLGGAGLPFGSLAWTDKADGGNFEAKWSMTLPYGLRPAPIVKGAVVEIFLGPGRRWYGQLDEADWDSGDFSAIGMSRLAGSFAAEDSGGSTSTVPDTIIDTAISHGWAVNREGWFGVGPLAGTGDSDAANYVGPILDQYAENVGRRWGVWADGRVRAYLEPTAPTLILAPGVIELGETTEDTFSTVVVRFVDSLDGATRSVRSTNGSSPVREYIHDIRNYGPTSSAVAGSIAANLLTMGKGQPGWSNGVEVTSAQLMTLAGLPVDLASVSAGIDVMRAAVTAEFGVAYRDLLIGESTFSAESNTLQIAPTETVAASYEDHVAELYSKLTGTPVAA